MIWTLAAVFAGGLALNLTPCVYPLIPITVSYFGGRSGENRGRVALHGLLYLTGLALTNSILGVLAALTGSLMGAALQNPLVLVVVAAALVSFATSLFGFWEVRLPAVLTNAASRSYTGYFGTLFMGITLGAVAAPCLGPFVLGLLTWVAGMGSPWLGFIVFFTLSLGLGTPLFVLALFAGNLERLPGSGAWMIWVRKLMGWVLIGMAVHFLRPLLPPAAAALGTAGAALAAAFHLGWIDDAGSGSPGFRRLKTAAGTAGIVAAVYLAGSWFMVGAGIDWRAYSHEVLTESEKAGKPVIIDFSATWCTPCREFDETTFRDPEVVRMAESGFTMVRVDLTRKNDALRDDPVRRYSVKGVPTVVFLDGRGRERRDLRVTDYFPPDRFLNRMSQLKGTPDSAATQAGAAE